MDRIVQLIIESCPDTSDMHDWFSELIYIRELPETYAHPYPEELCLEEIYKDL
jgi:hypothetical protein